MNRIVKCLFLWLGTFPCEPLLRKGKNKNPSVIPFLPLWPDPISNAMLEMRHKYSELVCRPGIKGLSRKLLSMTLRKGVISSLPHRLWKPCQATAGRWGMSLPVLWIFHPTPRISASCSRDLWKWYLQGWEGRAQNKAEAKAQAQEPAGSFKH